FRRTIRMSTAPDSFGRCKQCAAKLWIPHALAVSLDVRSHILGCGHVICDRCRDENASQCGKVLCTTCSRLSNCFSLPSRADFHSAPTVLRWDGIAPPCSTHPVTHVSLRCSCGEFICDKCTEQGHAGHFHYSELVATDAALDKEMQRVRHIERVLMAERTDAIKQKKLIENQISAANNEIANEFTLIIAQAISRCLHLMTQTRAVARRRTQQIVDRIIVLERKLASINQAIEMAGVRNTSPNLSVRLCVKKAAISMSQPLQGELRNSSPPGVKTSPSLSVIIDNCRNKVLDSVAKLGEVITTNLIDKEGTTHQVIPFPTPLVRTTKDLNAAALHFSQFHQAILPSSKTREVLNISRGAIGIVAAPLVIPPPHPDTIQLVAVVSANDGDPSNSSDRPIRYHLSQTKTPAAVATATVCASSAKQMWPLRKTSALNTVSAPSGSGSSTTIAFFARSIVPSTRANCQSQVSSVRLVNPNGRYSVKGWKPARPDQRGSTSQSSENAIDKPDIVTTESKSERNNYDQSSHSSRKRIKVEE
ncbi:hypothetical protein PFISCL1PPCAC_21500, partial [Pristionchus fissidentatus]